MRVHPAQLGVCDIEVVRLECVDPLLKSQFGIVLGRRRAAESRAGRNGEGDEEPGQRRGAIRHRLCLCRMRGPPCDCRFSVGGLKACKLRARYHALERVKVRIWPDSRDLVRFETRQLAARRRLPENNPECILARLFGVSAFRASTGLAASLPIGYYAPVLMHTLLENHPRAQDHA